jgi:hypothetical protein
MTGPFATGWGARAGGTARTATAATVSAAARVVRASARPALPPAAVRVPFTARFTGRLTIEPVNERGRLTVRIDGALSGATRDHLEILIHGVPLQDGGVAMEQSRVSMGTSTALYRGEVTALDGTRLVAAMRSAHQALRLGLTLQIGRDGRVTGPVHGTASTAAEGTA